MKDEKEPPRTIYVIDLILPCCPSRGLFESLALFHKRWDLSLHISLAHEPNNLMTPETF